MHCLQCYYSEIDLENHNNDCIVFNGVQATVMPPEGSKLFFKNHHKQLPAPFVIYADFEAITQKITTCEQDNGKSYTQTHQRHEACGFGYKVVCHYDKTYSKPTIAYRGSGAVSIFLISMFLEVQDCQRVIKENFNKPLNLTEIEGEEFQKPTHCWICNGKYKSDDTPVRDHCHITGKYRGSAHDSCNLKLQISAEKVKIPVIFHSLKGSDSHFKCKKLGNLFKKKIKTISEETKNN